MARRTLFVPSGAGVADTPETAILGPSVGLYGAILGIGNPTRKAPPQAFLKARN